MNEYFYHPSVLPGRLDECCSGDWAGDRRDTKLEPGRREIRAYESRGLNVVKDSLDRIEQALAVLNQLLWDLSLCHERRGEGRHQCAGPQICNVADESEPRGFRICLNVSERVLDDVLHSLFEVIENGPDQVFARWKVAVESCDADFRTLCNRGEGDIDPVDGELLSSCGEDRFPIRFGVGPEVLAVEDAPKPVPGRGEVLIRQLASSVNGGDLSIRAGHAKPMAMMLTPGWPKPLGMDVVGLIEQLGTGVADVGLGDLVWGVSTGSDAIAEYVVMKANRVAAAPRNLEPNQLGAIPVAGTTAMAAVDSFAKVKPGDRVLVRGGAGGVGSMIVQFARARGARLTALASNSTRNAVTALGAHEVLDYRQTATASLPEFDVVIDTIGSDLGAFRKKLAKGGRFVTITLDFAHPIRGVAGMLASTVHGKERIRQMVSIPKSVDLAKLTGMCEAGKLHPVIDATYSLSEIRAAHKRAETRGTVGKIVVAIASQ